MAIYKIGDKYFNDQYQLLGTEADINKGDPPSWAKGAVTAVPLNIQTARGNTLQATIDYASGASGLPKDVIQKLLDASNNTLGTASNDQLSKQITSADQKSVTGPDFSQYLPGYKDAQGNVIQHGTAVDGVIGAIPDGSYMNMDGKIYLKQGKQAIPYQGNAPQNVINVPISAQQWNMAGSVLPETYAIKGDQTLGQSQSAYNKDLNDTTTPRVGGTTTIQPVSDSSVNTGSGGKTNASEIARAQQVWANANNLVGTPGYEGMSAQQIRDNAHTYADTIRNGTRNFDNQGSAGASSSPGGQSPTGNTTSGSSGGSAGASGGNAPNTTPSTQDQSNIQSALDIINSSTLDEHTKDIYREAVKHWDPTQEVNVPNILSTFADIKSKTIDPYFKEQTDTLIDQFKRAGDQMTTQRGLQLEAQNTNAQQAISGAQNNLEARGMTFTGEGVKQLGAGSAFAQTGTPAADQSAIPVQTQPFGGQFSEGLVNQGNRLIATGSQADFTKNLTDLSRQAEQQLGSAGSAGLVAGVPQLGNIEQSATLPNQKQQAEGSALSGLYGQEQTNVAARKPVNPFST